MFHFVSGGINLIWAVELDPEHEKIETYEIFYCRDNRKTLSQSMTMWKKMVEIKFVSQKMSCTMTEVKLKFKFPIIIRRIEIDVNFCVTVHARDELLFSRASC